MLAVPKEEDPSVRSETWAEVGSIQSAVLTLFTTGGSWAAGLIDWRAFLSVNLPLVGKAIFDLLRRPKYRSTTPIPVLTGTGDGK